MGANLTLVVTPTQARAIGAISTAASRDQARPTLTAMLLEWDTADDTLTVEVTCTDSYRLATRLLTFDSEYEATPASGSFLVEDAVGFAKALKTCAIAIAKPFGKDHPGVIVDLEDDTLTVTVLTGASAFQFREHDTTFPNWRQFCPDTKPLPLPPVMPAFSPRFLADVAEAQADLEADRLPVVLGSATGKVGDELKPWLFWNEDATGTFRYLIMPVRV